MKDVLERLPRPPDVTFMTGAVSSTDPLTVTLGTEAVEADRLTSYVPAVGHVVLVLLGQGSATVLGAIA